MLKRVAAFPFLFVLYLILGPLITNLEQISPVQALRPLAVLMGSAIFFLVCFYIIFKEWHYSGYLTLILFVMVFVFGHLDRVMLFIPTPTNQWIRPILLLVWCILLGRVATKKYWLRFGGAGRVTPALNLILCLAVLVTGLAWADKYFSATFASSRGESSITPRLEETLELNCTHLFPGTLPDIYYISLDGYGRADVLKDLYGVDNSAFLSFLERNGFYVARESYANYMQTGFSLSASLSFSYPDVDPGGMSNGEFYRRLIANNRLMPTLKKCGYTIEAFETGFFFTSNLGVDITLGRRSDLSEMEILMLSGSLLNPILEMTNSEFPGYSYGAHRRRILYDFEQLQILPKRPGPKFIFAHIVSPHPPFVFDAQGNPIEPAGSYSIVDGDNYPGDWEEYRAGYAGQVRFLNGLLEKTIEALLANSSPPPVIIIQGDHGPGGSLDWYSVDNTCLWERTAILNAYYLPPEGREALYPSISPVNSFRVVLNTLFDANLKMQPDLTFFTSLHFQNQALDITGKRASTLNCPQ